MSSTTTNDTVQYRITTPRPIGGRMRRVGEVVALTPREAEAELPWGGLELEVAGTAAPAQAGPVALEAAAASSPAAPTDGPGRKRTSKAI
ncbi:hypothetical protein CCR97_23375 [Rhodoplanes elegans]|uniref:Uncharacterized protein n=1 Tax=Rhodoplanes elegans TaxID=29408 RepID=A0A327KJ57_9BRAD|nr:hypothetical protein [Rhodoplanes elegans]MBK5961123.1 hypothetical protein [Rhodoplanes elegans]RAI38161.1 hypothetical protein CH338_13665 [Rhodoplanes elegans]